MLETLRLILRPPAVDDAEAMAAYATENRAHLAPWEPPREEAYFGASWWRPRLAGMTDEVAAGRAFRLLLFRRGDDAVGGVINLTRLERGPFQAATLGFSLAARLVGQGLMHEALTATIRHAFGVLRLHRIEANHRPTNERSASLLRRLGFVVEGYARDYLFIDGAWRDHVLCSLTNPAPRDPRV